MFLNNHWPDHGQHDQVNYFFLLSIFLSGKGQLRTLNYLTSTSFMKGNMHENFTSLFKSIILKVSDFHCQRQEQVPVLLQWKHFHQSDNMYTCINFSAGIWCQLKQCYKFLQCWNFLWTKQASKEFQSRWLFQGTFEQIYKMCFTVIRKNLLFCFIFIHCHCQHPLFT